VLGAALLLVLGLAGRVANRAVLRAPMPSLLLQDRHGEFMAELAADPEQELGYWEVDEIPWRVAAATVAIEDRRFWQHPGVDARGVLRAALQNARSGEVVSGASTLAMQVARMQDPGPRGYAKKLEEALTALALSARYGRREILAHYLRLVPYGNRIHGIGYGARRYLDKPVADLSWAEVAFLAALPQAPSRTNPFHEAGRRRAVKRAGRILEELRAGGVIAESDHQQALLDLQALEVPDRGVRAPQALHTVLQLETRLRADPELWRRLARQPVLRSSLDLELQARVERLLADHVASLESRGAGNGAVVVLDTNSRQVLASVGSTSYFDARFAGSIDYSRVARYPGSTLKPFVYALALDRGVITPATLLDDLQRGPDGIGNADDRFLGPLLPRRALANSRNVPAVRLLERVGLDEGYAFLGELGLNDGALPAGHYGLGLAIGGAPVTLQQLVRAYAALADDGRFSELDFFPGRSQVEPPQRLLSQGNARLVSGWLSDPLARLPTFPRMGFSEYPFAVSVKTGTSEDYRDAWAVAFTESYVVGVWVGHPDWVPMQRVSGYRGGASLAQQVMERLHADRLDGLVDLSGRAPEGWPHARICPLSGRLAGPDCEHAVTEYFPPGSEPVDPCGVHMLLAVDRHTGALASQATPPERVSLRRFADLPSRYAGWAQSRGLEAPPAQITGGPPDLGLAALQDRSAPALFIRSPQDGLRVVPDPEVPRELATLSLSVEVDPPVEQVLWYVDGQPFALVEAPYTARWPLQPGEHSFQARVPFQGGASEQVRVVLR